MSYGFDQSFIRLNDLRMYLAAGGQGGDKEKLIKTILDDPTIEIRNSGMHSIFKANAKNVQMREEFDDLCRMTNSFLQTAEDQHIPMADRHNRATCVIVGCGEGFNLEFVQKAYDKGAVIIALGNAVHLYDKPQYWIGSRRPPAYVNTGFNSSAITAIYPKEHRDDKLWMNTGAHQMWSQIVVKSCPNTLFYSKEVVQGKTTMEQVAKDFIDNPRITNLANDSTLSIGLTFAASSGFSNIILHGTSFSDKYAFDEQMHPITAARKKRSYAAFSSVFQHLWIMLADRYVNVWGTEDVDLGVLRMPSEEDLLNSIEYSQAFSRAKNNISSISTPVEEKILKLTTRLDDQKKMLSVVMIADKVDDLIKHWPKNLKGIETLHKCNESLKEALAQKGACTGCAKNKLLIPAFQLFAREASLKEGKAASPINRLWKKVFPDNLTMMYSGDANGSNSRVIKHPSIQGESK